MKQDTSCKTKIIKIKKVNLLPPIFFKFWFKLVDSPFLNVDSRQNRTKIKRSWSIKYIKGKTFELLRLISTYEKINEHENKVNRKINIELFWNHILLVAYEPWNCCCRLPIYH